MSLVICLMLITFSSSVSNLEEADVDRVKFTHFLNSCRDDKQEDLNNKFDVLESKIQDLNYGLNTLSIIVDQLFEELKASLAEITKNKFSNGATITPATNTQQEDIIPIPSDCEGGLHNGTHLIRVPYSKLNSFEVFCTVDSLTESTDSWIVIQRRNSGSVDFNRNWTDYQKGFGSLEDEFFIGLEKLHALTCSKIHELWIQIETHWNTTYWARYSSFAIGDESESYALNVLGSYSGNAGDGLDYHAGQMFTTKDMDNDEQESGNCAVMSEGGWWFKDCYESNLNGRYLHSDFMMTTVPNSQGRMSWTKSVFGIKYVHMAIRPLKNT